MLFPHNPLASAADCEGSEGWSPFSCNTVEIGATICRVESWVQEYRMSNKECRMSNGGEGGTIPRSAATRTWCGQVVSSEIVHHGSWPHRRMLAEETTRRITTNYQCWYLLCHRRFAMSDEGISNRPRIAWGEKLDEFALASIRRSHRTTPVASYFLHFIIRHSLFDIRHSVFVNLFLIVG